MPSNSITRLKSSWYCIKATTHSRTNLLCFKHIIDGLKPAFHLCFMFWLAALEQPLLVDRLLIVVHQAFNAIKQTFLAQVNQIYWHSHGFHEPGLTGSESFIVTLACGQWYHNCDRNLHVSENWRVFRPSPDASRIIFIERCCLLDEGLIIRRDAIFTLKVLILLLK